MQGKVEELLNEIGRVKEEEIRALMMTNISMQMDIKLQPFKDELAELKTEFAALKMSQSICQCNFLCADSIEKDENKHFDLQIPKSKARRKKTKDKSQKTNSLEEEINHVDRFITTLKENSAGQPFNQQLPVAVALMQLYPTVAKVQLDCVKLIQPLLALHRSQLNGHLNANLIETMLTCLQTYYDDESIVVCCFGNILILDIAAYSIKNYPKTVEIFLKIISNPKMTTETKCRAVALLTVISGNCPFQDRNAVEKSVVEKMCELVRQQLNNPTYNRILSISWKFLKISSEIPLKSNLHSTGHLIQCLAATIASSTHFVCSGGMDLVLQCYEKFGDDVEMVVEMMGVMVVLSLHWFEIGELVSQQHVQMLWNIMLKSDNNVAISWRCVYFFDILLHGMCTVWPLDSPNSEEATNIMIGTINKWKLDAHIDIPTNTVVPYLAKLSSHKTPLDGLMSIYTIANLTTVDADTYCRQLCEVRRGVEILTTEVIRHPKSSPDAIRFASVALENTKRWRRGAMASRIESHFITRTISEPILDYRTPWWHNQSKMFHRYIWSVPY